MHQQQNKTAGYSAAFIFLAGISGAGLLIPREVGSTLLFSYFTTFFGYFWLCRGELPTKHMMAIGLAARLMLFFSMPILSDDVFRFIWDGYLTGSGVSPYTHLPQSLLNQNINGITPELYAHLNSQPYFSVYPPLNQAVFWLATLWTDSLLLQTNTIRLILVMADVGSFLILLKLLSRTSKKRQLAFWFFLNPLLILEGVGNVHFEGLVIFFLLLGIYYFETNKKTFSAVGFGLAIATKLLPLIYLPAILFDAPKRKGLWVSLLAGLVAMVTFIPFFASGGLAGMQSSLSLYFQKFEFNASIYFIIREIGFWVKGYNIIGTLSPWLSLITFVIIISLSIIGKWRKWPLSQTMLFAISTYLFLATTIHPWYILPLLALGILSGFYYPIIWSLFIFITYAGYSEGSYELSQGWIALEYAVVFIFFTLELFKKHGSKTL